MIRSAMILILLSATITATASEWYEHYEKGVRLIAEGQAEEAKGAAGG